MPASWFCYGLLFMYSSIADSLSFCVITFIISSRCCSRRESTQSAIAHATSCICRSLKARLTRSDSVDMNEASK